MSDTAGSAPYKLLMLSGGSLVGQNVLAALAARREFCHIVTMNSRDDEPAIFDYDVAYTSPSLVDARIEFEARFQEVLSLVEPDLVIPCRDEDVAFLAELAGRRPDLRDRLLCGDSGVASAMLDKGLSWEFSTAHGLPFAPAIPADAAPGDIERFVAEHGYPVIAKPRKGFASRGVRLLVSEAQVSSLAGRSDYILQKYLGDPEVVREYQRQASHAGVPLFHSFEETKISVQGCIGPDGKIGGICVTRNIMRHGKSERVERSEDPYAFAEGSRWVEVMAESGWRGPINIQCQSDQHGNLAIYEYNGRFTGASSARILLGFDEVGITLGMWLDGRFPGSGAGMDNNVVVRAPVSRVVDRAMVERIRRGGYWSAKGS